MDYKTLTSSVKDNIAYIKLNRPERLNSFDLKLGEELYNELRNISEKKEIRAVIIKGSGKGFCGGGDVKEMHQAKNKSQFLRDLTRAIHKCVIEIRTMEKPVIAAVNGHAFGAGLSLAVVISLYISRRSQIEKFQADLDAGAKMLPTEEEAVSFEESRDEPPEELPKESEETIDDAPDEEEPSEDIPDEISLEEAEMDKPIDEEHDEEEEFVEFLEPVPDSDEDSFD